MNHNYYTKLIGLNTFTCSDSRSGFLEPEASDQETFALFWTQLHVSCPDQQTVLSPWISCGSYTLNNEASTL